MQIQQDKAEQLNQIIHLCPNEYQESSLKTPPPPKYQALEYNSIWLNVSSIMSSDYT